MRFREIITEGRDAMLYHGYSKPHFAVTALKTNEMVGTSTQRWWPDGKRRKDNDPEYEKSYWMKGISTTRDIRFAMSWGSVVFELDQSVIARRYKIIPFNWGFSIPDHGIPQHHKREREEYIVTSQRPDTYDSGDNNVKDMERFREPEGSIKPLSAFLRGIYVEYDLHIMEFKKLGAELELLINHPLFKGYYDPGHSLRNRRPVKILGKRLPEIDPETGEKLAPLPVATPTPELVESAPSGFQKWMRGRCYDFALALKERFPQGEFVGLGVTPNGAAHVGLKVGNKILDARGALTPQEFVAGFSFDVADIEPIFRDVLELECGLSDVEPPYIGNQDIREARRAVRKIFG